MMAQTTRHNMKGAKTMPTEKEIKRIELSTVYELRIQIDDSEKTNFTKEEVLRLLDDFAKSKNVPV